jgi:hypothetical protein
VSSGPLSRSSAVLLDFFGITKNVPNFIRGMSNEIQPTIIITPYMTEGLIAVSGSASVNANAFNGLYNNTSNDVIMIHAAAAVSTAALGAGVTLDGRLMLVSFNQALQPSLAVLSPRNSSTVGQTFLASDQFFASPIPFRPGDAFGLWVDSLIAGPVTCEARLLISTNPS